VQYEAVYAVIMLIESPRLLHFELQK